jgi:hypothetical protein
MSPFTKMQPELSTSTPRADAPPLVIKQRTSEHIRVACTALELRIAEQIQASIAALLAQLFSFTCQGVPTDSQQPNLHVATTAAEPLGGKAAHKKPIDILNDDPEVLEYESGDFVAYYKVTHAGMERPPRDIDEPRLWKLSDDIARFYCRRRNGGGPGGGCARMPVGFPSPLRCGRWKPGTRAKRGTVGG